MPGREKQSWLIFCKEYLATWIIWKLILLIIVKEKFSALSEHIRVILTVSSSRAQGIGWRLPISKAMMSILLFTFYTWSQQVWLPSLRKYRWLSPHSLYKLLCLLLVCDLLCFKGFPGELFTFLQFFSEKEWWVQYEDEVKWGKEVKDLPKPILPLGWTGLCICTPATPTPSNCNHRNHHVCRWWCWTNLTFILCWALTKNINF